MQDSRLRAFRQFRTLAPKICPQNQILKYTTTNREGYREYKSESKTCAACPFISKCTQSKNQTKVITRHICAKYVEETDHLRHTAEIRETYKLLREFLPTLKNVTVHDYFCLHESEKNWR